MRGVGELGDECTPRPGPWRHGREASVKLRQEYIPVGKQVAKKLGVEQPGPEGGSKATLVLRYFRFASTERACLLRAWVRHLRLAIHRRLLNEHAAAGRIRHEGLPRRMTCEL